MTLETGSATVGKSWVLVGDGVTEFYASETMVGSLWLYMTAPDGAAPTVTSPHVEFNGGFAYRGPDAQDIYLYSRNGETEVGYLYA